MSQNCLTPFILRGCLVGAAAVGAMVIMPVPEARAACIPSDSVCTTFDPSSQSNIVNRTGFTGSFDPADPFAYTQARVQFLVAGMGAAPNLLISGISLKGDGIAGSLNLGSYTINSNSFSNNSTNWFSLATPVGAYNFLNSSISFTIPANVVPNGAFIQARIQVQDTDGTQINTSNNNFSTTAVVPAPLPLLGAAAAFGFSRKLRRRILQSA